jgi:hypothetical protein
MKGYTTMIKVVKESINLFNYTDTLDMIINPVNCKGVSKTEIAKQFESRFPRSHQNYVMMCKRKLTMPDATGVTRKMKALVPGDILHYVDMDMIKINEFQSNEETTSQDLQTFINSRVQNIIFLPVKNHWKNPAKLEFVEKGINGIKKLLSNEDMQNTIKTIGVPKLSSNFNQNQVISLFEDTLVDLEYSFIFFDSVE